MSIEDYEFYDEDVSYSHSSSGEIYLDVDGQGLSGPNGGVTAMLSRKDIIAMAKHFQLSFGDIFRGDDEY